MFCFLVFCSSVIFAQEDFLLHIDGNTLSIEPDKEYKTTINGKEVAFTLVEKDTLLYRDDLFSFNYLKKYRVSKTAIDENVDQIAILTAEGSGIMIQSYNTVDPSFLNEMMLNEVTKESISYGYEMKREDYIRTLKSGEELIVTKAVLTYMDDVSTYEVSSVGGRDNGILIVTVISVEDFKETGESLINLMWDSLEINLRK